MLSLEVLKYQILGLLSIVRMARSRIDLKLAEHGPCKFVLGEHTLDSFFDEVFRFLFQQFASGDLFQPANIPGVAVIDFINSFNLTIN